MRRDRNNELDNDDKHDSQDNDDDRDGNDVPLHRLRPFGAGLKRQRVEFVRATDPEAGVSVLEATKGPTSVHAGRSVEDIYASIVLKGSSAATVEHKEGRHVVSSSSSSLSSGMGGGNETRSQGENRHEDHSDSTTTPAHATPICQVCALPVTTSQRQHELSLAHQVSLTHSHPPSSLDRSRMGLRALESQGWDPDSRLGLGREGEGMRFPIKTVPKEDTLGIGARAAEKKKKREEGCEKGKGRHDGGKDRHEGGKVVKPKPLTKKERKALGERERQRAERLQAEMFGRIDVEKYLRGG